MIAGHRGSRPTLAPLYYEEDDGDEDTVIADVEFLARMSAAAAELEPPPEPRDIGDGIVVSSRYMQRVVDAARVERRARLGRLAPP